MTKLTNFKIRLRNSGPILAISILITTSIGLVSYLLSGNTTELYWSYPLGVWAGLFASLEIKRVVKQPYDYNDIDLEDAAPKIQQDLKVKHLPLVGRFVPMVNDLYLRLEENGLIEATYHERLATTFKSLDAAQGILKKYASQQDNSQANIYPYAESEVQND